MDNTYKIFVVSGGTGRTAKLNIKAALTQFPDQTPEIITFSDIRYKRRIKSKWNFGEKL
jgi:regulator of PEP synthase PpsR (kinase-PPPase family)